MLGKHFKCWWKYCVLMRERILLCQYNGNQQVFICFIAGWPIRWNLQCSRQESWSKMENFWQSISNWKSMFYGRVVRPWNINHSKCTWSLKLECNKGSDLPVEKLSHSLLLPWQNKWPHSLPLHACLQMRFATAIVLQVGISNTI